MSSGGHNPPNMAMQREADDVLLRTDGQRIRQNRDSLDRKDSIMGETGREGQELEVGTGTGRAIGVFTSGGDSQGMTLLYTKNNANTNNQYRECRQTNKKK